MKQYSTGIVFLSLFLLACNQQEADVKEQPAYKPAAIISNPSSTYLSPEESMKTMHLPEGYHLQLVASEPVIQEPVAMVWDGNGRLYVAEMRSYMQDINGTGQHLPTCRITRLEDTDGDGKMDKHTVFIDSLVLPRMILMLDDRLVVNETYTYSLYSYRDTDGDGKADEKKLLYHNDAPDNANLEHQRSGLVWNIDNWIYMTTSPARFRYNNGVFEVDSLAMGTSGQWGLGNDDYGRLFFSSAGGENPALDFQQNPAYGRLDLDSQHVGDFDEVWPIIATPDVQGGQIRLRADSTLNHFTASCGQSVFRGDRLPASMKGDLFICEPVGRLIRRARIIDKEGNAFVKNAYDKAEFLSSSDMNFRPVNTATGPDGCMYIADMYHGIIQESNWTADGSYLRPQILRKQLDQHINRGRIYRLVHDGYNAGPAPRLLDEDNHKLVTYLSHPNGWWRDNAQKLLVIRNDKTVVPALQEMVTGNTGFWNKLAFWKKQPSSLGRLHALWTLEGMHSLSREVLTAAYKDEDPQVRKAAIIISESYLKKNDAQILSSLETFKKDTSADVRIQLALSLRYSDSEKAKSILKELAGSNKGNELMNIAVTRSLQATDPVIQALKLKTAGMDEDDEKLVLTGAANFSQLCATCHGNDGKGVASKLAPPLAGSPRVNGNKDLLIKILLNGLSGPVDNKSYPDVMPAQANNTDEYIASVLSFARISLGNNGGLVKPEEVKKVRDATAGRKKAWTMSELNTK